MFDLKHQSCQALQKNYLSTNYCRYGIFRVPFFQRKKTQMCLKGKKLKSWVFMISLLTRISFIRFFGILSTIRSISILLLCLKMLLILVICLLFFKGKKLYFSEDGKVQRYWEMLSNLARIPKSDMLEGFFQNYLWSIPNYLFFITYKTNWQWKLKQTACYPY